MMSYVGRAMLRMADFVSVEKVEHLVTALVRRRADRLPPDEALRFLFRIDGALYEIEGRKSIEYGGGTHTKHRHTGYHDFFVSRVRAGERVLDVGCGSGALAQDLAERAGASVVGIDLNAANIDAAMATHAHPRVTYRVGDALRDIPNGPFDVVILSNVLEHLPHRAAFLRRLKTEARPGRFLIRVPLFERDWRVPLRKELDVEWRLDPGHETEYTLESFDNEMASANLNVTHREVRWGEIWAEAV